MIRQKKTARRAWLSGALLRLLRREGTSSRPWIPGTSARVASRGHETLLFVDTKGHVDISIYTAISMVLEDVGNVKVATFRSQEGIDGSNRVRDY